MCQDILQSQGGPGFIFYVQVLFGRWGGVEALSRRSRPSLTLEQPWAFVLWPYSSCSPSTGERYVYEPSKDTFLLYSLGRNQEDDGGRHQRVTGDIVWRGE